jgi:hypothetical protein
MVAHAASGKSPAVQTKCNVRIQRGRADVGPLAEPDWKQAQCGPYGAGESSAIQS